MVLEGSNARLRMGHTEGYLQPSLGQELDGGAKVPLMPLSA